MYSAHYLPFKVMVDRSESRDVEVVCPHCNDNLVLRIAGRRSALIGKILAFTLSSAIASGIAFLIWRFGGLAWLLIVIGSVAALYAIAAVISDGTLNGVKGEREGHPKFPAHRQKGNALTEFLHDFYENA